MKTQPKTRNASLARLIDVNCNRWDINRYMGITLQLTGHLNRLVIDEDPDECNTIGIESGTINHERSTINHERGTIQNQPIFLKVNRLHENHPHFSHISRISQKIHPSHPSHSHSDFSEN